jgi:hypothetical protein
LANATDRYRTWSQHLSSRQVLLTIWGLTAFFYGVQFLLRPGRLVMAFYRIAISKPFTTFEIIVLDMARDLFLRRKKGVG